ncbi:unnamed protein product [Rotaria sordida]|uniref:phosphoinositide 5-phosphatase n=1 Tax=Rotaria sordida TaxID=392033 RepID=A0A813UZU6_9BILA|nr:unnamed protein product [Rotaria sordida]CAF3656879.1 unnamed protein product [Rotaria sordida]
MFPKAAPAEPTRTNIPPAAPVANWSVALYRKAEPILPLNPSDVSQTPAPQQTNGSFYIQLQQQASSSSPSRSDVLYFRYQAQQQKNSANSYTLPFTISQLSNMNLSPDTAPLSSTSAKYSSIEQQSGLNDSSDNPPTLLLRAKAFLGVVVLNSSANSITANTAGIIRPFMLFVTEEVFIGQLFDAYIFRISQVATISMRDNPEDEIFISGIKKLFQGRSFYYATFFNPELNNNKRYFNKPYDITLCAQRMIQEHDSDIRFFWNRGLCLPLLKFNIDVRYWIPKIMCGGIETYRNSNEDIELWLISRLSCERAGTRFNVRGVNDDGAVANFVETEQIVFLPRQNHYSSFVIVRGSIPLFWHQSRFQVGAHRITVSRSEALSFKAFFEHFKYLYRHYGRILIINLVDQREDEKRIGEEYQNLFELLVKTYRTKQKKEKLLLGYLNEKDFIWFDYHEQARATKGLTPEQFVDKILIQNKQYSIGQELERQSIFTYMDETTSSFQQGVFRINCIDCLDRTNNVQLTLGMVVLTMQITSLKKQVNMNHLIDHLRNMWINNGDHISRIYTGTGAIGQRNKAKDIQRSLGRAIQNSLRDDEKQQSMQTLIYSYAKDSYLHERSVAALLTPYVISDGIILNEMFQIRHEFVRKEKFRISMGTWNINGDKNPALEDEYPSILDAWILDGPENISSKTRKNKSIPTNGIVSEDYTKSMPDILAIGFQEICDLTATNMVWQSSVNATRWVDNVQAHFKRSYPNDEYILLGNDQLVGVCLAIFIRRDLTPFVKNVVVDSVKTGMGGKIGNKGCVAIRLVLHNTSICFICAHFTAGQNEFNERNKDYKSIMEKLSFQPPSRALWHDHIFFLGDFNYRLTIPRVQVEQFIKNEAYKQLLQYDQLTKEHSEGRVFREFTEGPIKFPPTYKYDIGSDEYDTSEKARTPSYTDRILWRSIFPNIQTKQLYYGHAEVKTSDHRPVSAMFDIDVEICDETKMHKNFINIHERFKPSNAQIIFDIKNDINLNKNQLIQEFDMYVKKKYGFDNIIVDRFFTSNDKQLSLNMFFENGEHARKVMEPTQDQLPNGLNFNKRLIMINEDFALTQKLNLLFSNADETMYPKSVAYDLGSYQQPSRESLSTSQDVTVAGVVADANNPITTSKTDNENKTDEYDIETLELIKESARTFEQHRRVYGDIFVRDTDSDDENKNNDETKEYSRSSLSSNSDSDAPTSTDSEAPYGSDSESSSSYDEYHAKRKIPKKKIHGHHKGPLKLFFQERIVYWPKGRYKKYKNYHMKKHGIEINYGQIHTHEIKHSLKREKRERKKERIPSINLTTMVGDIAKQIAFVSLDPELSMAPVELDKTSLTLMKSADNKQIDTKPTSTFNRMTKKVKKSFKRKPKTSTNSNTDDDGQVATNNDATSRTSGGDELSKSIPDEESILIGAVDIDESRNEYNVGELISFGSFDIPTDTSLHDQKTNSLFNDDIFDPFNLYGSSTSTNSGADHYPSTASSSFHIDPFNTISQLSRETNSSVNMFSSSLINTSNNLFNQSQPQLMPTRVLTPTPFAAATTTTATSQPSISLKNLSLNQNKKKSDIVTDLLDLNETSPSLDNLKFDPYA